MGTVRAQDLPPSEPVLGQAPGALGLGVEDIGALVHEHLSQIFGYLARRVGRDLAEDLTAETFARALRYRSGFDPARGTEIAWLFGIATGLVSSHRRTESRRLRALSRLAPREREQSPEEATVASLDAERLLPLVARALSQMPRNQRDALYLVGVARLSYEEAASALSVPIGTVRSRVSRARAQLVASLPEDTTQDPPANKGARHAS
ncbi:MAG: RNA polymerase sigma factor [Acidimicrobiales bacterium]